MKQEFLNAVCKGAKIFASPFVAFLEKAAMPNLIAEKEEALELAKQGKIKDQDTGDIVQEHQPGSPGCRALVQRCQADLRAHTPPENRAEELYHKDASVSEDGPEVP